MRSAKAIGILALGFAAGVLPAMGATREVTNSGSTWTPNSLQIAAGDDVRWSWSGFHNVAIENGPRSGEPTIGGSGSFERRFDTPGTFKFRCEAHSSDFNSGMVGTITVSQSGTTTTTTTTTDTTGTDTTPTTTTPTTTTPADTAGPEITNLKRRASRRALTVSFTSDEDGSVEATIRRRNPGARAFRVVARRTAAMAKGANVVTFMRAARGLRRGAYRVTLVFTDESANESRTRTLVFKLA